MLLIAFYNKGRLLQISNSQLITTYEHLKHKILFSYYYNKLCNYIFVDFFIETFSVLITIHILPKYLSFINNAIILLIKDTFIIKTIIKEGFESFTFILDLLVVLIFHILSKCYGIFHDFKGLQRSSLT